MCLILKSSSQVTPLPDRSRWPRAENFSSPLKSEIRLLARSTVQSSQQAPSPDREAMAFCLKMTVSTRGSRSRPSKCTTPRPVALRYVASDACPTTYSSSLAIRVSRWGRALGRRPADSLAAAALMAARALRVGLNPAESPLPSFRSATARPHLAHTGAVSAMQTTTLSTGRPHRSRDDVRTCAQHLPPSSFKGCSIEPRQARFQSRWTGWDGTARTMQWVA
mmetsp:Transcript_6806/g.20209  ORF Transcript_6806/g.20209 Transcript_6806/m.20209 type:complete len:222 (-) Transcript_6806:81-746(-)